MTGTVKHILPAKGVLSASRPVVVDTLFYEGSARRPAAPVPRDAFPPPRHVHQLHGHAEPIPPHTHGLYEVAFVLDGAATHITDDYSRPLVPGSVVIVAPGKVHAFEDVSNLTIINVSYLTEWVAEDLPVLWEQTALVSLFLGDFLFERPAFGAVVQLELDRDLFRMCLDEINNLAREAEEDIPSRLFMRVCLIKVMVLLSRAVVRQSPGMTTERFRREVWGILEAVEESITRGTPLETETLAGRFGLTRDYLTGLFHEATGTSIREYHQRRRAQQAASMLLQPGCNVTDVAHTFGYADASHFSRLFRRYYGKSPKQYQKQYLATAARG